MTSSDELISVLMIGTGEYTTGYVHGQASDSDKVLHLIILYFDDVVALLVIIIYIYIHYYKMWRELELLPSLYSICVDVARSDDSGFAE